MGTLAGWEIEYGNENRRIYGEFHSRKEAFDYLKKRFNLPAGMSDKQVEKATNTIVIPFFEQDYYEPWV